MNQQQTKQDKKNVDHHSSQVVAKSNAQDEWQDNPVIQLQNVIGNHGLLSCCGGVIQRKLKVGASNDKYEQEADQVADFIVNQSNNPVKEKVAPFQISRISDSPSGQTVVAPQIENQIKSLNGKGQSLDKSTKELFEPYFGDLNHVRIHSDSLALSIANSINAKALTYGNNIILKSANEDIVLSHELTHVKQQYHNNSKGFLQGIFIGFVGEVGTRITIPLTTYDINGWRGILKKADEWENALRLNAFMAKAVGHPVFYSSGGLYSTERKKQSEILGKLKRPLPIHEKHLMVALLSTDGIDLREIGSASPVTSYLLSLFIKKNYIPTIEWLGDLMFEESGMTKYSINPSLVQQFLEQAGGTFSDLKKLRRGKKHGSSNYGLAYTYDPDIRFTIGVKPGSKEVSRPRAILQDQAIAGAFNLVAKALDHASNYKLKDEDAIKYARIVENHGKVLKGIIKEVGRIEKLNEDIIAISVGLGFGAFGTTISKIYTPLSERIEKSVAWDIGTSAALEFMKDRSVAYSKELNKLSSSERTEKVSEKFHIKVGECVNKALEFSKKVKDKSLKEKITNQIRIVRLEMKNAFRIN